MLGWLSARADHTFHIASNYPNLMKILGGTWGKMSPRVKWAVQEEWRRPVLQSDSDKWLNCIIYERF